MRLLALVFLLSAAAIVVPAGAEVVEIPLPDLIASYPADGVERQTTFHLPSPPLVVNGAWFRASGTAVVGTAICDEGVLPWPMDLEAFLPGDDSRYWVAYELMPEQSGSFTWTAAFTTSHGRPATWDFLLDGTGELRFYGAPTGLVLGCAPGTWPSAELQEAVLLIDAQFAVPTSSTTWSRIKGLYR